MPAALSAHPREAPALGPPPFAAPRRPVDVPLAAKPTSPALSATPTSRCLPQTGPIHLHKNNFPLLHSLLQSPEYLDAVANDPELTRRSSTRHTSVSTSTGASSSRAQRKPSRSGGPSVADLWSKVPRAFGSASSVAGSFRAGTLRREHRKKHLNGWDVVEAGAAVETLTDEAAAAGSARSVASAHRVLQLSPGALSEGTEPTSSGRRAAPYRAAVASGQDPQLASSSSAPAPVASSSVTFQPTGQTRTARRVPPFVLLASHSLPDLPTTASLPPSSSSPPPSYSARSTQPHAFPFHLHPPPSRPSTAFATAVSSLKRMLTRSTRPSARSPRTRRSRSFGIESAFSASTIFGGGGGGGDGDRRPRATSGLSGGCLVGGHDVVADPAQGVVSSLEGATRPACVAHGPPSSSTGAPVGASPSAFLPCSPSSTAPASPGQHLPGRPLMQHASTSTRSSKPPVSRRSLAPPRVVARSRPASLSAFPVARPSLDRNESTSTSYASYGRRWEGTAGQASASPSRRSLSVRLGPSTRATSLAVDDVSEKKVWSKWRRWVRERREAMRKPDERRDGEK